MGHENINREEAVRGSSDRAFGFVFAVVFLLVASYPLFFGDGIRVWSVLIALAFGACALAAPDWLAPLNRVWTRFGFLLHKIVSPIVLGVMFFGVVAPTGLLMRLVGKDPLRLRLDEQARTYWIERRPPGPSPESFKDQF